MLLWWFAVDHIVFLKFLVNLPVPLEATSFPEISYFFPDPNILDRVEIAGIRTLGESALAGF